MTLSLHEVTRIELERKFLPDCDVHVANLIITRKNGNYESLEYINLFCKERLEIHESAEVPGQDRAAEPTK